jgi:hypothetical protein
MIFTICKQCVNQKLSWANQNKPCVNFFPSICKPRISVIPKSFAKSWTITAFLDGVIMCPTFLVRSVEVTSSGQKKITLPKKSLHGLHYFAPRCVSWQIQHFRIQHMLARDPILTSALWFLSRIYSRQLAEASRMCFGYHDACSNELITTYYSP